MPKGIFFYREDRDVMSNVIVVGCGRVGSQLANMLSDNGNNVCCIDKNADAFANLGRNFNEIGRAHV